MPDWCQIAGGLLLGGVGLEMMNSRSSLSKGAAASAASPNEPGLSDAQFYSAAVVPIGIPLTIGAGTLSAVVLFAETAYRSGTALNLLAAIVILVLLNTAISRFSSRIVAWLGEVGLTIFIKLMGLFTLAIGVEFLTKGLGAIYVNLRNGALTSLG